MGYVLSAVFQRLILKKGKLCASGCTITSRSAIVVSFQKLQHLAQHVPKICRFYASTRQVISLKIGETTNTFQMSYPLNAAGSGSHVVFGILWFSIRPN